MTNGWQSSNGPTEGWRLTCSNFSIVIRSTMDGEGWACTCHALDIEDKLLQSVTAAAAKREAVRLVTFEVRKIAMEAEVVFAKYGRAQSVKEAEASR